MTSFLLRTQRITQPEFEERLRKLYSDTLKEPVPREFMELLERLS